MKKLTGKAKKQFEKWFSKNVEYDYDNFNRLPESMQWGVYQDWADSMGYHVSTYMGVDESIGYEFEITVIETHSIGIYPFERKVKETDGVGGYSTRQEARNAAIEKLNEIYNNKN